MTTNANTTTSSDQREGHKDFDSFLEAQYDDVLIVRDRLGRIWTGFETEDGDWYAIRPRDEDEDAGPEGDEWRPVGLVDMEALSYPVHCVRANEALDMSARVATAVAAERERLMGIRVPVNGEPGGSISLAEFEQAYIPYGKRYGQSAERVCERGGFSWRELSNQLRHEPTSWRPIPGDRLAYQSQRNRAAMIARSGS